MGIVITKQAEIDAYFESTALSQSKLKTLLKGMDNFLSNQDNEQELYYSETGHFILGSAIDCKLTAEEGEFEKQYYVSQIEKKPSDAEMSIINMIFDELIERDADVSLIGPLHDYQGDILNSCNEHGWQSRWKAETRIQKIIEVGSVYFEDLKAAYGKQVIDTTQKEIIDSIVMSLTTNSRTAKYFDRESQQRQGSIDVYYQLPIYFTHQNVECKALIDILFVIKDEAGRVVSLKPVDLKTMSGNTLTFINSVKARRYDIQAGWYVLALTYWLQQQNIGGVNIQPFEFIIESTTQPGNPLVYVVSNELLDVGINGRKQLKLIDTNFFDKSDVQTPESEIIISREIKGFSQLFEEFVWFEENNWKEERVVQENDGVLQIDWNGIIN
jgi:hypothetical protein